MRESASNRYQQLTRARDTYLQVARECARVSIPWLAPPEGWTGDTPLPEPYQGFNARCVTNLASRLMIALYPPGQSSFRLDVPAEVRTEQGEFDEDDELQKNLTQIEQLIGSEIERKQWRAPSYRTLKHLIVTGNALEHMMPDNRLRTFRLDQYVVVRDGAGDQAEIILEEQIVPEHADETVRPLVEDETPGKTIPLYTWCKRQADDTWTVHQEVNDQMVPGSDGQYRTLPFRALCWTKLDGEDYGRGKAEDHLGDMRAIDGMAKAMLDGSAMAARHLYMVRPNATGGRNMLRKITKAENGDAVVGSEEDVTMLQFENIQGMQLAQQELGELKSEVGTSFMLFSSQRRDAERVTATEVRQVAEELEGILGGVYSMLSQDLQEFRINRLILQMQANRQLPEWPEGVITPTILTGLEALGREQDLSRVSTILQILSGIQDPGAFDYVDWQELLTKAFNGAGLPGATRDEQEVQQIRQQRAMQEAMAKGGQAAMEGAAKQMTERGNQ